MKKMLLILLIVFGFMNQLYPSAQNDFDEYDDCSIEELSTLRLSEKGSTCKKQDVVIVSPVQKKSSLPLDDAKFQSLSLEHKHKVLEFLSPNYNPSIEHKDQFEKLMKFFNTKKLPPNNDEYDPVLPEESLDWIENSKQIENMLKEELFYNRAIKYNALIHESKSQQAKKQEQSRLCFLQNAQGDTMLHIAAKNNHSNLVRILLATQVNLNVSNKGQEDPLSYAIGNNNPHMAFRLISAGADVSCRSSHDLDILLKFFTRCKKFKGMQLLLKQGANPNVKDCWGESLLHRTVLQAWPNIPKIIKQVEILVTYGADINEQTMRGEIAFDNYKVSYNSHEKLEIYLQGLLLGIPLPGGITTLHMTSDDVEKKLQNISNVEKNIYKKHYFKKVFDLKEKQKAEKLQREKEAQQLQKDARISQHELKLMGDEECTQRRRESDQKYEAQRPEREKKWRQQLMQQTKEVLLQTMWQDKVRQARKKEMEPFKQEEFKKEIQSRKQALLHAIEHKQERDLRKRELFSAIKGYHDIKDWQIIRKCDL